MSRRHNRCQFCRVARRAVAIAVNFAARRAIANVIDVVVRCAFAIIIDVVAHCTITIILDFVARCAVAIIVDNGKMPAHRQRQRRNRKEGKNAITMMAKSVVLRIRHHRRPSRRRHHRQQQIDTCALMTATMPSQ